MPPRGGPPQLATSTSMAPKVSFVRATSRLTSSAFVTSAAIASTSAPVLARTSAAAASTSASVRAHIATFAPSAPNPSAHARPMPLLAAVTSATLPLSPRSMDRSLVYETDERSRWDRARRSIERRELASPADGSRPGTRALQMIAEELGDAAMGVARGLGVVGDGRPAAAAGFVAILHVGQVRAGLALDVEIMVGTGIEHDRGVGAAAP